MRLEYSGGLLITGLRTASPDGPMQRGLPQRAGEFPESSNPLENSSVACMKHCSILALGVLCSQAYQADGVLSMNAKKGAEERDVCHG